MYKYDYKQVPKLLANSCNIVEKVIPNYNPRDHDVMLSLYTGASVLEAYKNKLKAVGLTTTSFIKFTSTVQSFFEGYLIRDALEYAPNSIEFCDELSSRLEELIEGLALNDEQQNQIEEFVEGKPDIL